ncbi:MAG: Rieske (2Fe-2S) protein [Planctomycetota bacterium]|nr:Rieske (2Fe-2S) protein [Planctomycetota bacterium]
MEESAPAPCSHQPTEARRGFLCKAAAVIIGGVVAIVPFGIGLFAFMDPLRRRGKQGGNDDSFRRITKLDAIPDDGLPRRFSIIDDRVDAWTLFRDQPVGVIYLRRTNGNSTPEAFSAVCPHLGCAIGYAASRKLFQCPCHNSAFELDGAIIEPSPSPRPMDTLPVEVRGQGNNQEVWVKFESFYTGRAEKIVKS